MMAGRTKSRLARRGLASDVTSALTSSPASPSGSGGRTVSDTVLDSSKAPSGASSAAGPPTSPRSPRSRAALGSRSRLWQNHLSKDGRSHGVHQDDRAGRSAGSLEGRVRGRDRPRGPRLSGAPHPEPESAAAATEHRALRGRHARPFGTVARRAGDARHGRLPRERLLLLNAGSRGGSPCRKP